MNEEIQKLITQADEDSRYFEYIFGERLAELVIRECANVIHKRIGPKSALDVLEHFGVEE